MDTTGTSITSPLSILLLLANTCATGTGFFA